MRLAPSFWHSGLSKIPRRRLGLSGQLGARRPRPQPSATSPGQLLGSPPSGTCSSVSSVECPNPSSESPALGETRRLIERWDAPSKCLRTPMDVSTGEPPSGAIGELSVEKANVRNGLSRLGFGSESVQPASCDEADPGRLLSGLLGRKIARFLEITLQKYRSSFFIRQNHVLVEITFARAHRKRPASSTLGGPQAANASTSPDFSRMSPQPAVYGAPASWRRSPSTPPSRRCASLQRAAAARRSRLWRASPRRRA